MLFWTLSSRDAPALDVEFGEIQRTSPNLPQHRHSAHDPSIGWPLCEWPVIRKLGIRAAQSVVSALFEMLAMAGKRRPKMGNAARFLWFSLTFALDFTARYKLIM